MCALKDRRRNLTAFTWFCKEQIFKDCRNSVLLKGQTNQRKIVFRFLDRWQWGRKEFRPASESPKAWAENLVALPRRWHQLQRLLQHQVGFIAIFLHGDQTILSCHVCLSWFWFPVWRSLPQRLQWRLVHGSFFRQVLTRICVWKKQVFQIFLHCVLMIAAVDHFFADMKSTVSPTAMMQIAPSSMQAQHAVLQSSSVVTGSLGTGNEESKLPGSTSLAQNHTTLHAMLSNSNQVPQQALHAGANAQQQMLHSSANLAAAVHPSGYSTRNPDVLAGLTPGVPGGMTSYAPGLPLSAAGTTIYSTQTLVSSQSPNSTQMVVKSESEAMPGSNVNSHAEAVIAALSKASSEGMLLNNPIGSASAVTLLSGMAPPSGHPHHANGGNGSPAIMYSLANPSPPKAVPVMMEHSEEYANAPTAERSTPTGTGSPPENKADVVTLAPAQISTGAQWPVFGKLFLHGVATLCITLGDNGRGQKFVIRHLWIVFLSLAIFTVKVVCAQAFTTVHSKI